MADKLSWTELRKVLASRAGVSEKAASAFLSAFSDQLVQALKNDKQVKINGLGIFKLQAVADRKSINVTTGEQIIIPGYNKIVFAPESGVKELVETMTVPAPEMNDPIQKLGAQAEEIVDILGDLGQSPKQPKQPEIQETPETPEIQEAPETPETPEVQEAPETPETPEVQEAPEKPFIPEVPTPAQSEQPKKQANHFVRDVLICMVILLLLLFGTYFFLRGHLSSWIEEMIQAEPMPVQQTEQVEPAPQTEPIVMDATEEVSEPIEQLQYTDWITTEPMHQDSRLTWMAKRFDGAKIYWPYIFDANRDQLPNPNFIKTGTPIRVPKLTALQRDTTNAQTLATIERLRLEAEALMR